jgi:metal transporter CNNM
VLKAAHSRIPVYSGRRTHVVGILLVKTLLMLEPSRPVPVRSLLAKPRYSRPAHYVPDTMPLYDLLSDFQKGKCEL